MLRLPCRIDKLDCSLCVSFSNAEDPDPSDVPARDGLINQRNNFGEHARLPRFVHDERLIVGIEKKLNRGYRGVLRMSELSCSGRKGCVLDADSKCDIDERR